MHKIFCYDQYQLGYSDKNRIKQLSLITKKKLFVKG